MPVMLTTSELPMKGWTSNPDTVKFITLRLLVTPKQSGAVRGVQSNVRQSAGFCTKSIGNQSKIRTSSGNQSKIRTSGDKS